MTDCPCLWSRSFDPASQSSTHDNNSRANTEETEGLSERKVVVGNHAHQPDWDDVSLSLAFIQNEYHEMETPPGCPMRGLRNSSSEASTISFDGR